MKGNGEFLVLSVQLIQQLLRGGMVWSHYLRCLVVSRVTTLASTIYINRNSSASQLMFER